MHEATHLYPALLASFDTGIEREFEARVREASDLAIRVAFGVLRRREDAEEVAQEAFTKAYRHFAEIREAQAFRGWIVRATWRLAIDRWRADRRRNAREQVANGPALPPTAEDLALAAERSSRLWEAIDELPEKLRIVTVLAAIQGEDLHHVAALLEVPEGTIKSRLFLARKALAKRLRGLANDSTTR